MNYNVNGKRHDIGTVWPKPKQSCLSRNLCQTFIYYIYIYKKAKSSKAHLIFFSPFNAGFVP